MAVNRDITEKVADLIKIAIPSSEIDHYASQLNTALDQVDVLQEINTESTPITAQTHGLTNIFGEDRASESLNMDDYHNNKNFRKGYFVVKKVI